MRRVHGQRSEEADAAPVRGEVGADQLPVQPSPKRGGGIGHPAGADVTGVAHERAGLGQPEEGAEGQSHDGVGRSEVVLTQRTHAYGTHLGCADSGIVIVLTHLPVPGGAFVAPDPRCRAPRQSRST